ncbi:hypothetical protein AOLI_G00240270 [Acnodon oligacanthus]
MTPARLLLLSLVLTTTRANDFKVPPHEEVARMARFVVNRCDWASMATISTHEPVKGQPFSNAFSISDGAPGNGTGTPYMYLTHMEISVQDLQVNPQASMSVSLAQTSFCKHKGYDPQSPLCAHIILSGSVQEVNGTEAEIAKMALFSRHPEMIDWPVDHNWTTIKPPHMPTDLFCSKCDSEDFERSREFCEMADLKGTIGHNTPTAQAVTESRPQSFSLQWQPCHRVGGPSASPGGAHRSHFLSSERARSFKEAVVSLRPAAQLRIEDFQHCSLLSEHLNA